MAKKQVERYTWLRNALSDYSSDEIDTLLRCSKTLSRWSEHECNGAIQRDEETNLPYWYSTYTGRRLSRTADRETGALTRARTIVKSHGHTIYYQGDPRGCSLYIIRPYDVPTGGNVDSYYTNGIAVCID